MTLSSEIRQLLEASTATSSRPSHRRVGSHHPIGLGEQQYEVSDYAGTVWGRQGNLIQLDLLAMHWEHVFSLFSGIPAIG